MHWIWTLLSPRCPDLCGGLRLRSKIRGLTQDKNGIKRAQRCKITEQRTGKNTPEGVNRLITQQPPVLLDNPGIIGACVFACMKTKQWIPDEGIGIEYYWNSNPIFQRGIQHTSKAASAISLLDLGLMDSRGAWTHTGIEMYTHTHTGTYTIQQLCLIRFTTAFINAPQTEEGLSRSFY